MSSRIRTRFAPSPTGFLHVGGLRTALYSYLFAKHHGGDFLLRIEDTDRSRLVEGAIENMINTLEWAGLSFDEGPGKGGPCGPYIQSERLDIYQKHAQELIDQGKAYVCFCSSERLEKIRMQQQAAKLPPAYDRLCRDLTPEQVAEKKREQPLHVVRMKVPLHGERTFTDLIRGSVTISYKAVDDQVILKSDGFPTYHLAVVVDDHYMKISHVIRGEEWLPSTPKHLLLFDYFGWQVPAYAHLPLLLNPDRSKLSKRQGDVAVEDYRAKGYLKDALVNFVAFLGWNPGDTREVFSLEELIKEFTLERVGKSGAVFNVEKLDWLNSQYIMKMSNETLLALVRPLFDTQEWKAFGDDYLLKVIGQVKDRAVVLNDFVTMSWYFFDAPTMYDDQVKAKMWHATSAALLRELAQRYEQAPVLDAVTAEKILKQLVEEQGVKLTVLLQPLRLALTGLGHGPSSFAIIEIIGKDESLARIRKAVGLLG